MLLNELQKIGFSDKEALVYLASLELGTATILEISKKAKVKRPTTYVIFEDLIKKGLASSFEKGKKRYFQVESPERLLTLFRLKEKELQEQEREFKVMFPQLKDLYALSGEKPSVRFFEGKEGIKAIQEDILKSKVPLFREFVSLDEAYKYFPPKSSDSSKKIKKHARKVIYTSKKGAVLPLKDGPIERVFVNFSQFPFSSNVVIYQNKVAIISYASPLIGILLENKEIANSFSVFFDLAFNFAKSKTKK
ncbi:MAG: helix-turn-helix domain-containing protein [bacterium]|nr:helix-turn-helix domain-containing protein [bacterium]